MRKNNGFGDTKAILHQMNDLNIYQVTDSDLDILALGNNSDLYLEIALCSISVFASFLCTLLTLDFKDNTKEYPFYVIVTIISAITAVVFFLLWYRNRRNSRSIIDKIKSQKIVGE